MRASRLNLVVGRAAPAGRIDGGDAHAVDAARRDQCGPERPGCQVRVDRRPLGGQLSRRVDEAHRR